MSLMSWRGDLASEGDVTGELESRLAGDLAATLACRGGKEGVDMVTKWLVLSPIGEN